MLTRVSTRAAAPRVRPIIGLVLALALMPACITAVAAAAPAPFVTVSDPAPKRLCESVRHLDQGGSTALSAERLSGIKAPDRLEAVVLMCDFADSLLYGRWEDGYPEPAQSEFYYLAHDSIYFHHQMTDVRAYFDAASGGRFELDFEVVPTVANLPHAMSWYGNHPEEGEQKILLARDAVAALDDEVDFSRYDTVVLIHAGAGEETDILGDSPEQIYSSYLGPDSFAEAVEDSLLDDPWLPTADGIGVDQVLVLPETEFQDPISGSGGYYGSLGVYCFEVALRLGMLSLSDFTPSGSPDSQGIGEFGLMGYGLFVGSGYIPAHPCAFNKMLMGWLDPFDVDPAAGGTYTLDPAELADTGSSLARVVISPSEYWLVEYRREDPDGNGIFSHPGDLNGNNVPDFYDADSAYGDGTPTSWYDSETDDREWLYDAEFDFFMSENSARDDGVKGAGSGLYVWHVDETVIEAALLSGQNIFNADPQRKSVDLEEADGIQDLDSRVSTAWVLGGDDDSYRAEDVSVFGPDTSPSTATAGGVRTGIVIDQISAVVADSNYVDPESGETIILYENTMSFRCRLEDAADEAAPQLVAELDLPDVDLRGSHLLAADLDGSGDGVLEIVVVGDAGRVFVFDADLTPFLAGGPATGLFAVGTDADGAPVTWTGPAAVGDPDGDGSPELVLTAASGLYVFNGEDATEMVDGDGDADSYGLAYVLEDCRVPPVLYASAGLVTDVLDMDRAALVDRSEATSEIRVHLWSDDDVSVIAFDGEEDDTVGSPVWWGGELRLALRDAGGAWSLIVPGGDEVLDLPLAPSGMAALATPERLFLPADDGRVLRISDPDDPEVTVWSEHASVLSPLAPGPYYVGDGEFVSCGASGYPRTGWPTHPRAEFAASDAAVAASPLVLSRDGDQEILFATRDGRLYLYGSDGTLADGWPVAGPGRTAGTPLLMDLDGEPGLELVAVGAAARLSGHATDGEPTTEPVSGLKVWSVPGTETAEAVWPMWGGDAARRAEPEAETPPSAGTKLIVSDSHICYPAPLTDGVLHVRVLTNRDCQVRAYLYNLEGEEVRASGPVQADAGPVEILMDVDVAVSGIYLCRLIAEDGGDREVSVRSVAIAR